MSQVPQEKLLLRTPRSCRRSCQGYRGKGPDYGVILKVIDPTPPLRTIYFSFLHPYFPHIG
ncbi:UNVERIFIED_CONTAM: hypothetical protein Slati_3436100 [Sesamum latifolium]|uniref:Uncharacterized protein n=1 Tax=Sesamum latifolium TaxID=2727402 RepID=A0AAW2UI59_9LAMI